MKRSIYEHLWRMNQGFHQVLGSLRVLRKHAAFDDHAIRRFEELAAEARAVTNSYLLEALGTVETDAAGRWFRKRLARERKEERG